MILVLVDEVLDVLDGYCSCETLIVFLFTVVFAVCVELFCAPDVR